jgi:homoserine kinase
VGVGFDVLGLALSLRNELTVRVTGRTGRPVIHLRGEGVDGLPVDERNAVFATMKWLFRKAGRRPPRLEITCVNRIPLARGLGSSSTAYLAALLAANRLLGDKFSREQILDFATELEGHPDNVAPALYGGMRISGVFNDRVVSVAAPAPRCRLIAAVPSFQLSTARARAALPSTVPLEDAVHNLSSVALLPHAMAKDERLLIDLLQDRLHEPYRARLVPGFYAVRKAARKAGAYAVTLSGAGPTLLAFAPAAKAKRVAAAMRRAFLRSGVESRTMDLKVDMQGAIVR